MSCYGNCPGDILHGLSVLSGSTFCASPWGLSFFSQLFFYLIFFLTYAQGRGMLAGAVCKYLWGSCDLGLYKKQMSCLVYFAAPCKLPMHHHTYRVFLHFDPLLYIFIFGLLSVRFTNIFLLAAGTKRWKNILNIKKTNFRVSLHMIINTW